MGDLENSYYKEKIFATMWSDGSYLNLLWLSLHNMYLNQIIMVYALILYHIMSQLYISKTGKI